jgi:RNA polymerase sigma-70 factor (ECF subfamily)
VRVRLTFADVYNQNVTFVWRTLRALGVSDAAIADAAQDAFVVVHRKLPDFDGGCAIRTWLFRVVYLVACEYRRRALRTASHDPVVDGLRDAAPDPAEAFERREASSLLSELLAELDDEKRIVLVLAEIEEMSVPEIAEIVGAPVNTVYTRLRRARVQMSETLRARQRGPS